jgi:large subunit ribosomal protein L29
MTLPKYTDLKNILTLSEIEDEILVLSKNLFDLRMKKSTSQKIKPHLFKHTKRRISQLNFKKTVLLKFKN